MVTVQENELMTLAGPGTPTGQLLRRYWQPISLAHELTQEKPRMPVKLLGEKRVLFRDRQGGYGLLGEHCSHRGTWHYFGLRQEGAPLPVSRVAVRLDGRCLEQPFEPSRSVMRHSIRHPASRSATARSSR